MYIEDGQWPWPHHPVTAVDGQLVADEDVTVDAFHVRPLIVEQAANWCGGVVILINGGPAILVGGGAAGLGDFIVRDGAQYRVVAGADMPQRYQAAAA